MDFNCKLVKKTFTADNGEVREYYVLQFSVLDNDTLDITIKKEKAQLLLLSQKVTSFPEESFWNSKETNSLN